MDNRKAKANARRLKATVQRVEQQPYDFASGRRLPRPIGGPMLAITTGSITARSGTVPGSGPIAFQSFDGTNLSSTGNTGTAYNLSSTAIATGKYVLVEQWGGKLWVTTAEC